MSKETLEYQSYNALKQGMITEAVNIVDKFESEQKYPRGLGLPWGTEMNRKYLRQLILKVFISNPSILNLKSKETLYMLRISTGMEVLWSNKTGMKWFPKDKEIQLKYPIENSIRMLYNNAIFKHMIEQFKEFGFEKVKIVSLNNCCNECKKISEKVFTPYTIPEIPYEKCTNPDGCRCYLGKIRKGE